MTTSKMNKINYPTIDTSSEIFVETNLTPNCEYDIEINNLMNNQSLQSQYESFKQLILYINGSKIDEVYEQNVLDEEYKKFLLLDLQELNTTETSEIYKNNDQISNCNTDITTNSTVNTFYQPIRKRYRMVKVLKNGGIINTTGTSKMYTQTNFKSNCEVDIEKTGHVNTSKKVFKDPVIIDYIDISSASDNETYKDNDRNANYYGSNIVKKSPGNTSQQTSKKDHENLECFEIITVFPSEINQKYNGDSDKNRNGPGNTFNQTVQKEILKKLIVFNKTSFCGFQKANIDSSNYIEKLKNDSKNLKNRCSNNVNKVDSTWNAHENVISKKCLVDQEEKHDRLPITISIKKLSESKLSNSKRVFDSSQLSSAQKKRKSEQSKNNDC